MPGSAKPRAGDCGRMAAVFGRMSLSLPFMTTMGSYAVLRKSRAIGPNHAPRQKPSSPHDEISISRDRIYNSVSA